MSVNRAYSSKTQNGEVESKYFVDSKNNKDDSLSEFKEPKKNIKAPQTGQKPKIKPTKKPVKRPRNQKDIRTALKSTKKDLVAYSKDFDAVCKQSGLDVDSEQLQLAIALSRSLQNSEESLESHSLTDTSKPSTSRERVGNIRKTLLQYGFKVPEVKINTVSTKKGRKKRKDSKLLLITEAERQQNIANRYSQILLENIVIRKVVETECHTNNKDSILHHLATNVSYEDIRDINVFFVKDLLENNTTRVIGSLLRDWSKIPGRPLSPVAKVVKVKFDKMNLNPEEIDTVLSGSVVQAQEMVKGKCVNVSDDESSDDLEIQEVKKPHGNDLQIPQSQVRSYSPDLFDDEFSAIDNSKDTISGQTLSQKSCSQPDSQKSVPNVTRRKTNDFMDLTECVDVFSLPPIARNKTILSDLSNEVVRVNSASNSQKSDDLMEMTDCVVANPMPTSAKNTNEVSLLSQNSDDSKDITERALLNPKVKDTEGEDNIDLTQDSDSKEDTLVNVVEDKTIISIDDGIDLTQSDHSDDDTLPVVHISGQKTRSFIEECNFNQPDGLNCTIAPKDNDILSHDEIELNITKEDILPKHTNLEDRNTSSSKHSSIFDEFVFKHSDHQSSKDTEAKLSDKSDNIETVIEENEIDLTQNTDSSKNSSADDIVPTIVYDNNNLGKKDDVSIDYDEVYMNETLQDIDSTQPRPESTEANFDILQDSFKPIDDASIDYDEVYLNKTVENINSPQLKDNGSETNKNGEKISLKTNGTLKQIESNTSLQIDFKEIVQNNDTADNIDDYIDIVNDDVPMYMPVEANTSKKELSASSNKVATPEQSQEVFEISDEELNYSMHKSKHIMNDSQGSQEFTPDENDQGNFDFGGISILDNISHARDNLDGRKSIAVSKSDSILPSLEIRGVKVKIKSKPSTSEAATPTKGLSKNTYSSVQTPNNTDYLIKTNNVTPILDYAAMTTPDRNKELEKYGLKPFKRKRAIQLLNHLYTQTHPVVETHTEEDLPSPSKKRKRENHPANSAKSPDKPPQKSPSKTPRKRTTESPRKSKKSPRKCSKSPVKSGKNSKEDNIEDVADYSETSSVPVIRDIECSPEDWVFQKKEKAKVHSCRVPLHIAFHNYVSCRRVMREAILRYQPVNIDVMHRDLTASGHRYDPKDLLRFLDKKCITVKTADNNGRNKKS